MRLQTQFRLVSISSLSSITLIGLLLVLRGSAVRVAFTKIDLANQIIQNVTSISSVLQECQEGCSPRAAVQLSLLDQRVQARFAQGDRLSAQERQALDAVEDDYQRLWAMQVEIRRNRAALEAMPPDRRAIAVEYDALLSQQLNMLVQRVINQSFQLHRLFYDGLTATRRISSILLITVLLLFALLMLALMLRAHKTVRATIDDLIHVAQQIRQGDMQVATGARPENEFRDVYAALSQMASELQCIHDGMALEIAERKRALDDAQEQLVRREKLAVLGQLAAGVGHELRNPLGVIANAVYYLNMVLRDGDATVQEYLHIIEHEVHNSQRIVTDLLDFSRIKSIDRRPVSAAALVQDALSRCAIPDNVGVTTRIADDLPALYVDPDQIVQVLTNLVTNACQAMPGGGEISLWAQPNETELTLSVADTGCGISEDNLRRLFEPLFTTKPRGIGLGLAVSKNLIQANGGRIALQSQEGQGTTFTLDLPLYVP